MLHSPSRKKRKCEIAKVDRHRLDHCVIPGRRQIDRCVLEEQRGGVEADEASNRAHRFQPGVRPCRLVIHFHSPFRLFVVSRLRDTPELVQSPSCGVLTLSHDNIPLYILFDGCAMRIFRNSFVAPRAADGSAAASRCGNCLCAKGLRRRFRTPEKYFSGELSNCPNTAPFKNSTSAKTRSSTWRAPPLRNADPGRSRPIQA